MCSFPAFKTFISQRRSRHRICSSTLDPILKTDMSKSDLWDPTLCVTMHFSQDPPQSRESMDVLLTYSTDAENAEEAKQQARILAERHFGNVPKDLRVEQGGWIRKSRRTPARCTFKEHGILIRNMGFVAPKEQGDDNTAQWFTSVWAPENLLIGLLGLPESSFLRSTRSEEDKIGIRTQISYAEWQNTVGEPRRERGGRVQTSTKD